MKFKYIHRSMAALTISSAFLLPFSCGHNPQTSPASQARDQAIANLTDSIDSLETAIANARATIKQCNDEVGTMLGDFSYVENPRHVEGYTILRSWAGRYPLTSDGVAARIRKDENFEIVAACHADFDAIAVRNNERSCQSETVPYDQALHYRTATLTTVAFDGSRTDSIGRFVNDNEPSDITLDFIKAGKNVASIKLSADTKNMMARTWRLFNAQATVHRLEHSLPLMSRKAQAYELERQRLQTLNPDSARRAAGKNR